MSQDTATNIIKDAMLKGRIIDPRETPDATDLDIGFREFKRMIKTWGIAGNKVWASTLDTHTLTSGTASYSIGSGGDIDTVRPHSLAPGSFVQAGNIDYPLTPIGQGRYAEIMDKSAGVPDHPSRIWYDPKYPLGYIYLQPPGGGTLNLYSWKTLAEPANVAAEIAYPDEYQDAIVWNLCCRIMPVFAGDPTPYQMAMAKYTLDQIKMLNAGNDWIELDNEMVGFGAGNPNTSIDAG